MSHSTKKLDLTGQRFRHLTVLGPAETIGKQTAWRCLCDCGRERVVKTRNLRSGRTGSCGRMGSAAGLPGLMDGEYFADTAQNSTYFFSAGLKFRVAQVLPDTGSLTVTKTVSGSAAREKVYSFTVTGPNDYFALVNITGPGSVTLTGLEPGEYTVTEDRDGAAISGYRLSVTGSGEAVEVAVGEIANITIDNAYTTPGGGGGGGITPTPPQDPEDPENPETPETPEIPEEEVPLTDIPEEETPLSELPELPEAPEELEIPEEEVPLADVPETGDLGGGWMMALLMGAMGMLWAALSGKDRKRAEGEEG